MNSFPTVSILVTHYNRSRSLEALLKSFEEIECKFAQIVVSDDGSQYEHLNYLKKLQSRYSFHLVTTPSNKGLGNNINKGQDVIDTPYTLYVQEDFVPTSFFPEKLHTAISFMDEDPGLDIVRFYSYLEYPYMTPFKNGFSYMNFNVYGIKYSKLFYYSDHPHLRRTSFFDKFGRYQEGLKVEQTEYKMCVSFIQNNGKGLFYNDYQRLFIQKNSTEEPSTVRRNAWRRGNNYFVSKVRNVYRQIKYNFDLTVVPFLKSK